MFVNATPTTSSNSGIIHICLKASQPAPKPTTAPKPATRANVNVKSATKTYVKCGGVRGTANKCCGAADRCVEKHPTYAQCRPKLAPVPNGWTGKIRSC